MWSNKNKQEVMDNLNHSITSNETEENKTAKFSQLIKVPL